MLYLGGVFATWSFGGVFLSVALVEPAEGRDLSGFTMSRRKIDGGPSIMR